MKYRIGLMARWALKLSAAAVTLLIGANQMVWATDRRDDAADLVNRSQSTLENFIADPDMGWVRSNVRHAQGVLVLPSVVKAGFIFGGSGGQGVLLTRDKESGQWGYPAFYTLGSASFGLQLGVERAELLLLIMTQRGLDSLLTDSIKLGVDASIAAGPVGTGAKVQTADILAFSRTKGVYGGLAFEGAVLSTRDSLNRAYYGQDIRPVDIVIRRNVSNPQAEDLRRSIMLLGGDSPPLENYDSDEVRARFPG